MLRPLLASLLLVGCVNQPPPVAPAATPTPPPSATRDFDSDGFMDPQDRCPRDRGIAPLGCPEPDYDGDGLVDAVDRCMKLAEHRNGYQDSDGCPDEIPQDLAALTGVIKGIYFDLDKDTIKPKSHPALDRAVDVLSKYPAVRIEVAGHTDNTANPDYGHNPMLSRRRAYSVKIYLVEHGIDEARIETRGAGPDEPIYSNDSAKGRAMNRRIEFTILVQ